MVQRRAARYVTNQHHNTSSITAMLDELGWETLECRRKKLQLTLFDKIFNNLVDIPASDYLTHAPSRLRSNHKFKYRHLSSKSDCLKHSFFHKTSLYEIPFTLLWRRLLAWYHSSRGLRTTLRLNLFFSFPGFLFLWVG